MFGATDTALISALGTAVVGLALGLVKALIELKKARIVEQEVDAQTIFNGYNHLYIELKEQIVNLRHSNEKSQLECDRRIEAMERRHQKEIDDLKEHHAKESRELRVRIANLESRAT